MILDNYTYVNDYGNLKPQKLNILQNSSWLCHRRVHGLLVGEIAPKVVQSLVQSLDHTLGA